jgi:hypothetical protein
MTQTSQNQNQKENENIVNGVNVTNLFGTIDAITENPTISKFNFRAKGKWINGGHNQTTINDFYGACQTHTLLELKNLAAQKLYWLFYT